MVKHVVETVLDDIDGSKNAATYTFGLNGEEWSIDLSDKNAKKLSSALEPFITAGKKVGGRKKARGNSKGTRKDLADVRAWGQANGYSVSERGRVPAAVLNAYDATN
jgi:hypothetical protein